MNFNFHSKKQYPHYTISENIPKIRKNLEPLWKRHILYTSTWVRVHNSHVPNTWKNPLIFKKKSIFINQRTWGKWFVWQASLITLNEQTGIHYLPQSSFKELWKWYSAVQEVNSTHIQEKIWKAATLKYFFIFMKGHFV